MRCGGVARVITASWERTVLGNLTQMGAMDQSDDLKINERQILVLGCWWTAADLILLPNWLNKYANAVSAAQTLRLISRKIYSL